ncbi:MAG: histidine kinase [Bacteroidota bacterium]
MNRLVHSPLAKIALISSGIMAIYGFIPVALLVQPSLSKMVVILLSLFMVLLIIWTINILVFHYFKGYHHIWRYVLSYVFALSFIFIAAIITFEFIDRPENRIPFPFYPGFTINTLILILMYLVDLKSKKDAAEYRLSQSRIKHLETEKQILTQQLQPHFLFNALSTLKSFIKVNPDKAETYIVKLGEFLRFSIEANGDQFITLRKELTFINDYLDLQKLRFGDGLRCTTKIESNQLDKKLPVFALQILVENAIKHNAFTVRNPLEICIQGQDNHVIVSNNLIPQFIESNSTSTGLSNLQKRYKVLGDKTIEVEKKEYLFKVTIPLLNLEYERSN